MSKIDRNLDAVPEEEEGFGLIGMIGVGKHGKRHVKEMLDAGLRVDAADMWMDIKALNEQFDHNPALTAQRIGSAEFLSHTAAEAVVIATPGATHHAVVKEALLAGKHVLVEKPFTRTAEEARELVDLAEKQNRILMVGHNRFYLPHFKRLKGLIESGKLGKILSVEGNYLNPPQQFDKTHTALEGLGYHQLYMIHALIGQDHPTEVVRAVRSEDSETFGLRLMYGDIPVTVKLSRNHDDKKDRTVIIRGEKFTVTFDYTKEPAFTQLSIEPTNIHEGFDIGGSNDSDSIFKELGVDVGLTEEEAKPSLHHQLLAFLEALRTKTPPPSNGSEAMSVVETLEDIRGRVSSSVTGVYCPGSKYDPELVASLAKDIYQRLGKRGGIVSIDGQSGTGKSTLTQELIDLYPLMYPARRAVIFSYDELRLLWESCSVFKKILLGQALNKCEFEISVRQGWNELLNGQYSRQEVTLWRNEQAENELRHLSEFFHGIDDVNYITIPRHSAYIKKGASSVVMDKYYSFRRGDAVILEGKFTNLPRFRPYIDFSVRVEDEIDKIRERFRLDRALSLNEADLDAHMRYYDLAGIPSWMFYASKTRNMIDRIVSL